MYVCWAWVDPPKLPNMKHIQIAAAAEEKKEGNISGLCLSGNFREIKQ